MYKGTWYTLITKISLMCGVENQIRQTTIQNSVQSHYMDVAECTCMVQRKLEQYLPEQERDFKSSFVVPFIPYKQEIRVGVLLKRGKKV